MDKVCKICSKRRAKFSALVKINIRCEEEMNMCKICYQKYIKLKERYIIKAYSDLIEQSQKVNKND